MMIPRYELNASGEWVKTGMVASELDFGTSEVKYDRPATGKNSAEGCNTDQQLFGA